MKKKKGFTLIELLVVVLIIGILAAIALPQYKKSVERARTAEAFINMKAVLNGANVYYLVHGTYDGYFDDSTTPVTWNIDITPPRQGGSYTILPFFSNSDNTNIVAVRGLVADVNSALYVLVMQAANGHILPGRGCAPIKQKGREICTQLGASQPCDQNAFLSADSFCMTMDLYNP